jgi:CheY-like chemotaxis protein
MKILLVATELESRLLRERILRESPQATLTCVYSYKRALERLSSEPYDKIVVAQVNDLSSARQELELQKLEKFETPIVFLAADNSVAQNIQDKHLVVRKEPGYDTLIGALFQMRGNSTGGSSKEIMSLAKSQAQTEQEVRHLKELVIQLSQTVDKINVALYGTNQSPGIADIVRDLQKRYEASLQESERKQQKLFHWRTTAVTLIVTFACTMIPLFLPQALEQTKTEQK